MRQVAAALLTLAAMMLGPRAAAACTGFCAVGKDGHVLVGNNGDWFNPWTKIRFIPANGAYGLLYTGFDDGWPQGGMNDRGRPRQNNDTQRWIFMPDGDRSFTIQQLSNGRFVAAHNLSKKDLSVVTRPAANNERWLLRFRRP